MHPEDLLFLPERGSLGELELVSPLQAVGSYSLVTLLASYALLFVEYSHVSKQSKLLNMIVRKGYFVLLWFSLFFLLVMLTTQCVWVLLAAFLYPTKFLSYGACVSGFYGTLTYQYSFIAKTRAKVKARFVEAFNAKVKERFLEALNERRQGEQGAEQGLLAITASDQNYEFDSNDLFSFVIVSGKPGSVTQDNTLTKKGFKEILETLRINVLPKRRDMLFMMCDVDCSGAISRDDFLQAWDSLVEELLASVLGGGLGLSSFQVATFIVGLAAVLVLLFVFLLTAAAAFNPDGTISSIMQAALILGTSSASLSASSTVGAAASASSFSGADSSVEIDKAVKKELADRIEPVERHWDERSEDGDNDASDGRTGGEEGNIDGEGDSDGEEDSDGEGNRIVVEAPQPRPPVHPPSQTLPQPLSPLLLTLGGTYGKGRQP